MPKITSKIDQIISDRTSQKERVWDKVQNQQPEMADFLTDMGNAFGKPKAIEIKIDGEQFQRGTFDKPKNLRIKRREYNRWKK